MTIALSVGEEHFKCDAELTFDFNPSWLLFNSRATRNAVVHQFVDAIRSPDFVIVERTTVVDGRCQCTCYVFNGAKITDGKLSLWDEDKQRYFVQGAWMSISKDLSYRLRYIAGSKEQKTITMQPFSGASFVDSAVMEIVKEYLVGRKDYW